MSLNHSRSNAYSFNTSPRSYASRENGDGGGGGGDLSGGDEASSNLESIKKRKLDLRCDDEATMITNEKDMQMMECSSNQHQHQHQHQVSPSRQRIVGSTIQMGP